MNVVKYMVGLNMKCNKVVSKVTIIEETEDGFITQSSNGIKVKMDKTDKFFDTRKQCKEYIESNQQ
ncbi:MAG: hypothetical protein WC679_01880 [Bacteroidales bacterium]|jgi:hypothetical protein